jgi:hypothetical protein
LSLTATSIATASTTTLVASSATHLLVVSLVLSQYLLSQLLLSLVDIRVELVSVLTDRKLLIIIDGDEDLS